VTNPTVSLVVVSRGRPDDLRRCLAGLEQLTYRPFEVVVVADPGGIAAIADWTDDIKWAEYDQANISAARNIGARLAAGNIIAFIDDDAVPEPSWLDFLMPPFLEPQVSIAGGYVLERDGINFQYRANQLDNVANHVPLEMTGDAPAVFEAPPGGAIKTEGTNFAIRRKALVDLGGFDEAYRYYLDETDLNMRLARVGARTAIVPLAQVHHGFAASERRTTHRRALCLFDIGSSLKTFLRKHAAPQEHAVAIDKARRNQRYFQEVHRRRTNIAPEEVERVMQSFEDGLKAAEKTEIGRRVELGKPQAAFKMLCRADRFGKSLWFYGRERHRRQLQDEAVDRVEGGERVTLVVLESTTRFLRVGFDARGFWQHSGGQFGRAGRHDRLFRLATLKSRAYQEIDRVRMLRGIVPGAGLPTSAMPG